MSPLARAADFSFEDLRTLISDTNPQDIDALLPKLPQSLRKSFALVYDSKSLQGASLAKPRVILYSENADFMMAYNGDPKLPGFGQLETIQWDKNQRKFIFREISFVGNKPVISESNPPKCLSCHGDDPRPNWEHYNKWPGVFGSIENNLSEAELAAFTDLKTHTKDTRYAVLEDWDNAPYGHMPRYSTIHGGSGSFSTNVALSGMLVPKNLSRVVRLMQATPDFDRFKYAVLGAFFCTARGNPVDAELKHSEFAGTDLYRQFFPTDLRDRFVSPLTLADYLKTEDDPRSQDVRNFWKIFEARDISTRKWSMDFNSAFPNLNSSSFVRNDMATALAQADPEIAALFKKDPNYPDQIQDPPYPGELQSLCATLKRKSQEALKGYEWKAAAVTPGPIKTKCLMMKFSRHDSELVLRALSSCVECHNDASNHPPRFELLDLEQFEIHLIDKPGTHRSVAPTLGEEMVRRLSSTDSDVRMPKGTSLSSEEREALIRYLQGCSPKLSTEKAAEPPSHEEKSQ